MFLTEGSGSGNLSTSSSCSETYTSFSDIKPWTPLHFLHHPTASCHSLCRIANIEFCQVSTESCIFFFSCYNHPHSPVTRIMCHTCTRYRFDCSAIVQWRYRIYKYITDSNFVIYVLVKWSSSSHTLVCIFLWRTEDPRDYNVIDVWMDQQDWSQLMHLFEFTLKMVKDHLPYVDDGCLCVHLH